MVQKNKSYVHVHVAVAYIQHVVMMWKLAENNMKFEFQQLFLALLPQAGCPFIFLVLVSGYS